MNKTQDPFVSFVKTVVIWAVGLAVLLTLYPWLSGQLRLLFAQCWGHVTGMEMQDGRLTDFARLWPFGDLVAGIVMHESVSWPTAALSVLQMLSIVSLRMLMPQLKIGTMVDYDKRGNGIITRFLPKVNALPFVVAMLFNFFVTFAIGCMSMYLFAFTTVFRPNVFGFLSLAIAGAGVVYAAIIIVGVKTGKISFSESSAELAYSLVLAFAQYFLVSVVVIAAGIWDSVGVAYVTLICLLLHQIVACAKAQ